MFVWYIFSMKKGDLYLFFGLIIPAVVFLIIFSSGNTYKGSEVTIYVGGNIVEKVSLNKDCEIVIHGLNNITDTLTVQDGKAYISEANCPNQMCKKSGAISADYESVCCAPGGILVVVNSPEKSEYDAITR